MSDFLNLTGKTFVVLGVANKKSVAWVAAKTLEEQGATVVYSVRSPARRASLETTLAGKPVFLCDVEHEGAAAVLAAAVAAAGFTQIHGIVHSIAFANYSEGFKPFHETNRADFLQATAISAFSLVEVANAFKSLLVKNASVVTIGISSLQVTPDNYGYMGPIKAALESATRFLAKSFSDHSEVRFNVVGSGPLKTSASAGIPGYLESYLFAEKLTFRKRNLSTQEVANTTVFLLSERSSGINGSTVVVDAGLGSNYFDKEVVRLAMRMEQSLMRFAHTCIESLAVALPDEVLSTTEIEEHLRPLYERLKLPFGRLELMTGIRERRVWPVGTRPSDASAAAGKAALAKSGLRAEQVELFIHSAVCRDMLEPATASFAHRKIGLPATAQIFDVSNACLGFLNALTVASGLIESGQIKCALVVSGENGGPLVQQTLKTLLATPLDRNGIKPFFANLTIGSGAVGAVVCHASILPSGARPHRLLGGIARAATVHSELCQGDHHGAESLAMQTDSEALLTAGLALAKDTWDAFTTETGYDASTVDRIICHQVGSTHRRKLYEVLSLDLGKDFSTFETLGNTGSVALPATLAKAVEAGAVVDGTKVALLGIGSGLNCLMLALEW